MRIGIDIDDTITDTWKTMIPIYESRFNIPRKTLENSAPYYAAVKDKMTVENYFKFMRHIHDEITTYVPVKTHAKEVINKLHDEGHTIILITSRGNSHTDAYKITEEYMKKKDIHYDKLVIECHDKAIDCVNEKIDLFIDDSNRHCESVSLKGIDVLQFKTVYNKDNKKLKKVEDWDEIYQYIQSR